MSDACRTMEVGESAPPIINLLPELHILITELMQLIHTRMAVAKNMYLFIFLGGIGGLKFRVGE